jgi:hypothetical protein
MTILYSWSATKCNRTIGTYWVDHSLKGRRMECIIETGLYRPRVKFLVMQAKCTQDKLIRKYMKQISNEQLHWLMFFIFKLECNLQSWVSFNTGSTSSTGIKRGHERDVVMFYLRKRITLNIFIWKKKQICFYVSADW